MLNLPLPETYAQQRERLEALYDLALEISALRDLPSVLNTALSHCLDLTESEFGFIGLNSADGKLLDIVAIQGFHPSADFYEQKHLIPLRPSLFALAILENRPIRSKDAVQDLRFGQPKGHPAVGTFMGVPLRLNQQPIGMIGVANRPTPYDESHEPLLMTYAAQVAIAIQNARLNEALTKAKAELEQRVMSRTHELNEAKNALAEKAAAMQRLLRETVTIEEGERQRISQDLHDSLNQLLVGALLEMRSSQDRLNKNDTAGASHALQQAKDILHSVEIELRQIIFDLRPPALDTLGLLPSIERYAQQFAARTHVRCEVMHQGAPYRLSADAEITLYRIVQEALQNVAAHAQAAQASVCLAFDPQLLEVTVSDDGCGFALDERRVNADSHFGLLGMRERAESLGGRFDIRTAPQQGTQVNVWVPVS